MKKKCNQKRCVYEMSAQMANKILDEAAFESRRLSESRDECGRHGGGNYFKNPEDRSAKT